MRAHLPLGVAVAALVALGPGCGEPLDATPRCPPDSTSSCPAGCESVRAAPVHARGCVAELGEQVACSEGRTVQGAALTCAVRARDGAVFQFGSTRGELLDTDAWLACHEVEGAPALDRSCGYAPE